MTQEIAEIQKVLPELPDTKSVAMKRVGVAVDVIYCAGQIANWGARNNLDALGDVVRNAHYDWTHGMASPERVVAAVDFICRRVDGGECANVRKMTAEKRRAIFNKIVDEAKEHEAMYRRDYKNAAQ